MSLLMCRVFPANSPTMDVVPRESSNRCSLGMKHKGAHPALNFLLVLQPVYFALKALDFG